MKTARFLLAVAALPVFLLLTGCSKQIDFHSSTEETLVRSKWGIEYYLNNQNVSQDFASFNLLFSEDGALVCKKENELFLGDWKRKTDNNIEIITIHLQTSNTTLELLNDDWVLTAKTSSSLIFESDLQSAANKFTIRKL